MLGPAFTPIGGGLLYSIDQFTSTAKLVGYQILLGSGVGLAFQNTVRLHSLVYTLFLPASSSFLTINLTFFCITSIAQVIAVQAELHADSELVPVGTALVTFFQLIGGVIGISISGTLFNNQLATELSKLGINQTIISSVKVTVQAIFALDASMKELVLVRRDLLRLLASRPCH